jgi:hypothetical protein
VSEYRPLNGKEPRRLGCRAQILFVLAFVLLFLLACFLIGTTLPSAAG